MAELHNWWKTIWDIGTKSSEAKWSYSMLSAIVHAFQMIDILKC